MGELKRFEYDLARAPDGGIVIRVGEAEFTPTDICSQMLRAIKSEAEAPHNLGTQIEEAQVAIPAYFDDTRTQEIVEAANRAGFSTVKTITEPAAASFAYGVTAAKENQYLIAVSMGAGTFEVAVGILTRGPSNEMIFMAKGIAGDPMLGGIDIDDAILGFLIEGKTKPELREQIRSDSVLRTKLREEAERAKIQLSFRTMCEIGVNYGGQVVVPPDKLYRKEIEILARPIMQRCDGPMRIALEKAGLKKEELDTVLLIGGPINMPVLREHLQRFLAFEDSQLVNPRIYTLFQSITEEGFRINPMQCVAIGAALSRSRSSVTIEATPYSYGSQTIRKQEVQEDGSRIITLDYNPIIDADSFQDEGTADYRIVGGRDSGIGRAEFKLIAAYKEWDVETDQPRQRYRELGTYFINIPNASPNVTYVLRRDPELKRVDLIVRHAQVGGEWVFHRVHVLTGRERKFPESHRLPPPAIETKPPSDSFTMKTDPTQAKLMQAIDTVEGVCSMLERDVSLFLSIRKISDDDRSMVTFQLEKLKAETAGVSGMQRFTEDRYVRITNQVFALIHDLEVTRPPLLERSAANEWRRRIPDIT
jgi:hypothetical protein